MCVLFDENFLLISGFSIWFFRENFEYHKKVSDGITQISITCAKSAIKALD